MELRRLRYFMQIAAEGSLGKASRSLRIAQPALGRQIQLLEAELGVQLFERGPKGMRLTDEGVYLNEALAHPLDQVDLALRNLRSHSTQIEATLVLGLPPSFTQCFGPRLVKQLRESLPNLRLHIADDRSEELAAALAQGLVDIALLEGVVPDEKVFDTVMLREKLLLVGAPDSALRNRRTVPFSEIPDFPLILPGNQASLPIRLSKLATRMSTSLNIAYEIDSTELTKQSVKAGLGYAILPPRAFLAEAERGELVSAAFENPAVDETVSFAIQPHWRVPLRTYRAVERVLFEFWMSIVDSGEWPAEWLLDRNLLSHRQ